jgi:hypothetical protein
LKDRKVVELMDDIELSLRGIPPNGAINHDLRKVRTFAVWHKEVVECLVCIDLDVKSEEIVFERYMEFNPTTCNLCLDAVAEARDRFGVCI